MNTATGRVLVVGGGVIGTACAYYLARAGWSVEVVERFSGLRAIELHANACGHATTERAGSSPTPIIRAARVSQMKLGLGGGDAPTRCWGKAILFALRDLLPTERFAKMALAESARF